MIVMLILKELSINKIRDAEKMTIRQTDNYITVCMNTWLLCEVCIRSESQSHSPNNMLIFGKDLCLYFIQVIKMQ